MTALLDVLAHARTLGLLGPGPVERHVEQAEAFVAALDDAGPVRLLDLGSGGGAPGLVLADRWPACEVVLLDAQARRVTFLREAVEALGWEERVRAHAGRAEEVGRDPDWRGTFPVVTARSFGPPAVTAECGAPLLAPGGMLLVADPPDSSPDRWPAGGLAELGLADGGVVRAGSGTVRRLRAVDAVGARYPRRTGVPTKRPLF